MEYVENFINEVRKVAHVIEFATKHKTARSYNSKVKAREMREGNLVLKQVVISAHQGTLQPN